MRTLSIVSTVDTPGKHDATGAFIPEAQAFDKYHRESTSIGVDCIGIPRAQRVKFLKNVLPDYYSGNFDIIALFCHGWPGGVQFGFWRKDVGMLADLLMPIMAPWCKIVLYACSTAAVTKHGPGTNGGFADLLRDALVARGARNGWIDAHLTAGHTTRNPHVVRFKMDPGALNGGQYIIDPKSPYWGRWVDALAAPAVAGFQMRYGFPTFTREEIETMLVIDGPAHI
jgi:hypothetical protein